MKKSETIKCKICGKKFKRRTYNTNHKLPKGVRNKNAVTCSKECSHKNTYQQLYKNLRLKSEKEYLNTN